MVRIKRAYVAADKSDGFRVLVDRLWPRGVSKKQAHIDLWMKEIAPSDKLRKWFGHDPKRWGEFQKRYREELQENSDLLAELRQFQKKYRSLTLIYAARDADHNQAIVLKSVLQAAGDH